MQVSALIAIALVVVLWAVLAPWLAVTTRDQDTGRATNDAEPHLDTALRRSALTNRPKATTAESVDTVNGHGCGIARRTPSSLQKGFSRQESRSGR